MNAMMPLFAWINGPEVIVILAVVLILFGAKKLPELAKGLGQGIREFKKSSKEIQDEINQAIDVDAPPPPPRQVTPPKEQTMARSEDGVEHRSQEQIEETVPPESSDSNSQKA